MKLIYPVGKAAPVTQTFAEHRRNAPALNAGIDWGVALGTPVHAAADGRVLSVGLDRSGYGNLVKVEHPGGELTLYAHLSGFSVAPGQAVEAGAVLGLSGNSGNSSGPHLHFEYRRAGVPVDPAPFLGGEEPQKPALFTARVAVDLLNVRAGPGTGFPILGTVAQGTNLTVVGLGGVNVWAELAGGRWVALRWEDQFYLEFEPERSGSKWND